MSSAGYAMLEATGLGRRFDDGQRSIEVLADLNLVVGEGESVAIVGESGVGKSTLLHLLGALDQPDAGSVKIGDEDLFSLAPSELARVRNRKVGFVFQFHHLLGDFDAVENVMMPLLISGCSRSSARERATAVLERVGLAERLTHRPGELSGGEQQRVAVARSIATEPQIVLADEPTGNLDPSTALDVQGLLMEIQRESRRSLVVATHSASLAAAMDRTLTLAGGRLHPGGSL
jgi:lipoprotein-releasing system ATP-binding protein